MSERLEYENTIDPHTCEGLLKNYGAVILRNFISEDEQQAIVQEVPEQTLNEVDRSGDRVVEQFKDTGWKFDEAPPHVKQLGERIMKSVTTSIPQWQISDVRAQLYSPCDAGIGWHRDYKRDLYVVAIASFLGCANFGIQLNQDRETWQLNPGDLTVMRGTLLNGTIDDRLYHTVASPEEGQRLSIAYRHVVDEIPNLTEGVR